MQICLCFSTSEGSPPPPKSCVTLMPYTLVTPHFPPVCRPILLLPTILGRMLDKKLASWQGFQLCEPGKQRYGVIAPHPHLCQYSRRKTYYNMVKFWHIKNVCHLNFFFYILSFYNHKPQCILLGFCVMSQHKMGVCEVEGKLYATFCFTKMWKVEYISTQPSWIKALFKVTSLWEKDSVYKFLLTLSKTAQVQNRWICTKLNYTLVNCGDHLDDFWRPLGILKCI